MSGAETRLGGKPVWPDPYVTGTIQDIGGDWSITDAGVPTFAGTFTLNGTAQITTATNENLAIIPGGTGYVVIGNAAAASRFGTPTNDDLFVSGRIECDGYLYADSIAYMGSYLIFLSGGYGAMNVKADDGLHIYAGNTDNQGNHNVIIASYDNAGNDYDHQPKSTNPTLIIHSATAAGTATDQWGSLAHDQTDFVITAGTGDIKLSGTANVTSTLAVGGAVTLASNIELTGGGSITTTSGGNVTFTPDAAGILVINSGASYTMTAAEKITVDAATTPHTDTNGVIDVNVEAGATGVSGLDFLMTSKSGGLGSGETIYGININMAGDSSDNANCTLATIHGGCDAVGSGKRWCFWADGTNWDYGFYTDAPIFMNATNIETDTSTGCQIGTASNQKLSFYGVATTTQPAHVADPAACAANTFSHSWDGATSPTQAEGDQIVADLAALKTAIDANNAAIDSILAQLATLGLQAAS